MLRLKALRRFLSKNSPPCLSFSPSSVLRHQLHSSLCACCRALNTKKNPAQSGKFFSDNRLSLLFVFLFVFDVTTAIQAQPPELEIAELLKQCLDKSDETQKLFSASACVGLDQLLEDERISRQVDIPDRPIEKRATLHQLHELFSEFSRVAVEPKLDFANLKVLLEHTLIIPEEKPKSIWERFIEWLKQQQGENDTDWNWLNNFLDNLKLPEWLTTLLFRSVVGLTVLLALGIVVNEIRHADGFTLFRKRSKKSAGPADKLVVQIEHIPDWRHIATLPLQQQPAALLKKIIAELVSNDLLPDNRSLTNGEYEFLIRQKRSHAAKGFSDVITTVDNIIYGNRKINPEVMDTLFNQADSVLTILAPGQRS